jgi:hypothetical protein
MELEFGQQPYFIAWLYRERRTGCTIVVGMIVRQVGEEEWEMVGSVSITNDWYFVNDPVNVFLDEENVSKVELRTIRIG